MTAKTAIITGVRGQDGRHLAACLIGRGYRVVGTTHGVVNNEAPPIDGVELVHWDLKDEAALADLVRGTQPSEVYNLAAYSSGAGMFENPVGIGEINGLAVTRMLEAIKTIDPSIRFCQASSSEMFGDPAASPQTENTPFRPQSPYGAAKLYAHEMVGIYRQRHGMFACSAILFNHESQYRGLGFVTQKVARAAASIKLGLTATLELGNLEARRDWGFSGDYVRGMWLMLQTDAPDDYLLATGRTHSVRDLCRHAFEHVGLDYRDFVREDPAAKRPVETGPLVGDASKAARRLGWSPSVTFEELVRTMVDFELDRLGKEVRPMDEA
jgi:GDPmannose 4,6-dehydratase